MPPLIIKARSVAQLVALLFPIHISFFSFSEAYGVKALGGPFSLED